MHPRRNVSVPSGDVYPNGVPVTRPDVFVQSTTHIGGSFFKSSPGFPSLRPGRHRLQKSYHGTGLHFTPQRFAEDVGQAGLPMLVEPDAVDSADIAELPGSERLDDEGKTTADDRIYLAEGKDSEVALTETVEERHSHTMDLDGIRTESRRWTSGLLRNPVEFVSAEYGRTPVKAVVIASGIVAAVYVVARDFERSYNRRKRRAGIAAAPAAAVETSGSTAATVVEAPAKVVKEVAEAVSEGAEAVAEGLEDSSTAVANAAS